ncbi:MAG: LuxR C-terminal-related transcriptional regulator [Chloroflexota bacterium]
MEGEARSSTLLGRDAEVATLLGAFEADLPVVVAGEPGIGKTTLVRAAAEAAGRRLREGGAFASLSWMPFLALERAVGSALDGDPDWVADAVERAIGPDLLFVDDAQWAAGPTLDATRRLLGRIAVVAAVRRADPDAEAVVELFRAASGVVLELGPLDPDDCVRVALRIRPDLSAGRARALAARAGGNPLLIEQLAQGDAATESLHRSIAARIRGIPAEARDALGLLALAERPLPASVLSAAAGGLVRDGLAIELGPGLAVRHDLLREAIVASLDPVEARALHRRLADLLEDPGERARHLAEAGDRAAAHAFALRAAASAATPGARAAHLGVAAATVDGPAADPLRIEAAVALRVAGDLAGAKSAIDAVASEDPEIRATAEAVRARILWSAGDTDGMRVAIERGLSIVGGRGTVAEAMLRAEAVTLTALVDGQFDRGLADAEAATELARRVGADPTRALLLRATILTGLGRVGWDDALEAVIGAARASGDVEAELAAANNLVTGHEMHGRPAEGRALALAMLERARGLRLTAWERQFGALISNLDLHAGDLRAAMERAEALLEEPLDPLACQQVGLTVALALVDLGRHEEASSLLGRLLATASPDVAGRGDVLWVMAEAALWGGRPAEALDRVAAYGEYAESEYPNAYLVDVTGAWAAHEAGGRAPARLGRGEAVGMLVGARLERDAVECLIERDARRAGPAFDEAARAYVGYHRRGELRSRWARAEALRRAGENAAALDLLQAVEGEAAAAGFRPLLGRIHRSLRLLGVRRSTRAPAPAGAVPLTARERDVAGLVARGLSNIEIARRLGLGRPTVARLLASAMGKLGADSRAQVAADVAALVDR